MLPLLLALSACAHRPLAPEPSHLEAAALRDRAEGATHRAFSAPVRRLEINAKFPQAEAVRDRLAAAGFAWTEDDWFGSAYPVPSHWEVKIGVDVPVPAAQAVVASCVLTDVPFVVVLMDDDSLGNRERVYVGALDVGRATVATEDALFQMLAPGLSPAELRGLVARVQ